MAAWHETHKPGLESNFWLGLLFALYLIAMLGLVGFVAWKVAHPLPHLLP